MIENLEDVLDRLYLERYWLDEKIAATEAAIEFRNFQEYAKYITDNRPCIIPPMDYDMEVH